MGFNSVAVIYNDYHGNLEKDDGRISRKIAQAMRCWTMRDRDRLATHFHAGQIVSQAHADYSQVVVVGKNTGGPINECGELDCYALDQIVVALKRHGYTVKPPAKKRKKASSITYPPEMLPKAGPDEEAEVIVVEPAERKHS